MWKGERRGQKLTYELRFLNETKMQNSQSLRR
jgi:hypothetical protein